MTYSCAYFSSSDSKLEDASIEKYFTDIDIVIHCAATAYEGWSVFSPSFVTSNIYEASVSFLFISFGIIK